MVYSLLVKYGIKVTVLQSNFKHVNKSIRNDIKEGHIFIETKPYQKNISIQRLMSHYAFAKDAFRVVEKIKPELLYVVVPPNSSARFAGKYKLKNKKIKLIFDIIDLWPETMPLGKLKKVPFFASWKSLRDKNIKHADLVITECELYREILAEKLLDINAETLYWSKKDTHCQIQYIKNIEKINLCYLGSINNIIDIEKIIFAINYLKQRKPVVLHLIGDGENKNKFLKATKGLGIRIVDYGKVYDFEIKQEIFNKCHFGLNIMKDSVCVGLTMKSIDYLRGGLPIINNIKYDTYNFVDRCNLGINIFKGEEILLDNLEKVTLVSLDEINNMKINARKAFEVYFSENTFNKKLTKILNELNLIK
jgi:hypothetical protein